MMDTTMDTLAKCFLKMRDRDPRRTAVRVRQPSGWVDIPWSEYYSVIENLAAGLIVLGVKPGDRLALMSNTRFEWGCMDLAALAIGAAVVPIYQNNTPEDTEYILRDSEPTVFVAENRIILKLWRKIRGSCPSVLKVVCFESDDPQDPGLIHFDALSEMGRDLLRQKPSAVIERAERVRAQDLATLIYTSGTTGRPKGVVLAHEQAISEVGEAFPLCGVTEDDISLSFLPYAHILGRIELWGHLFCGYTLAYGESIEKVRQNLQDVRPTILVAVPRIFEKVHAAIYAQMENQTLKRKLFDWAVGVGRQVGEHRLTRQLIPLPLLAQHEAAKKLVLGKIRDAFGGRLRFAISGGAPLHKDIATFFHAAGVLILEGYGLTETTAAVTVNTPFNYKFGSVGRPIGDVELRIAEDGEVLVRSKKVMREYYKNPEATRETIRDGWFHTGDIGEILPGGDLKITDRKKDLIKTGGGKYVAPQRLEGLLKLHPLIGHALIHGDQKKYIVALIAPDRANLEGFARDAGISYSVWTELLEHPRVQNVFRDAVTEANSHLASWESVKRFHVLPQEFTVEGGELTPSLKVKRKLLDQRLKERIEALYG